MNTNTLKFNGRTVIQKESFQVDGTFESMYAAQRWLKEKGYDYGSSCGMLPIGIIKGDYCNHDLPQKWVNFTAAEKKIVNGVMIGDFRYGPIVVYLFN